MSSPEDQSLAGKDPAAGDQAAEDQPAGDQPATGGREGGGADGQEGNSGNANAADPAFSQNVHLVERDGRRIYLVGTAHISQRSVEEVREVIEQVSPDTVCVELDPARHRALTDDAAWREMDIVQVVRRKQASMLLAHLILSAFQRRLGEKLGVKPGAEMLQAIRSAEAAGAELVLADRDVRITLRRTWANLGWLDKFKLAFQLMMTLVMTPDISAEDIERLKEQDMLGQVMESFAKAFPKGKETLIDERDAYLAEKLRTAPGRTIVAVVGAGHLPGMLARLRAEPPQPVELEALETVPKKSWGARALQWGIPLAIVALVVYGFASGGTEVGLRLIVIWILFNGVLSALGALAALAHPLTILAAFVAAPLTSLNPLVAAGWVAGLVEAALRKPVVKDFEALPADIISFKGFWRNSITRILLVVALSNLGSSVGTILAAVVMGSQGG
ncbi:MAG: TraB/GumN family protein [SAR324 cluster bacterium]|nr:TraB/GumN family protein [SAR324 cluster bacterium]MCH8887599.1 TraB/GumN family protein [SAR324 cluster bacterium]